MDKYFDNTSLLKAVLKWKWHIVALTMIAAIAGAIFSGPTFITPKYKSEAVVYPTGIYEYSDETFTEQMLQFMASQEIMDSIVKKFDLMSHYEIDENYAFARTALVGEYRDRVSISKTPYDAVKIKVLDKDPEMAYNIANAVIHFYNVKYGEAYKSKRLENAKLYKRDLDYKQQFIDSLKRELAEITQEGDMLNYLYLSKGNSIAYFSDNKNNSTHNVAEAIAIVELISTEAEAYSDIKMGYEKELRQAEGDMTFLHVVSHPYISDKKATPVRWIIVALCGISAFLLSTLGAIAIEHLNVKE